MFAIRHYRSPLVLFCLALTMSVSVAGCTKSITRDDLLGQMMAERPPLVVDVRSQKEYDRDHVVGAVHIPFYSIGSGLKARGHPKQDPVVLYCEHWPRASMAGFSLYLSGYDRVYSLEGHMKGWRENAFPIEVIAQ
jgi:rhodanese-related sulfurtransferase